MADLLDALWVEKYRPKSLDEVVLEEDQKEFLKRCLSKGEIPHLLFVGPAGSGKTTTARILQDIIIKDDMDLLPLNGSDQTGVDTVRDTIKGFLKSPPMESNHKIVFIDEFDYMTQNAQASLRSIMEQYSETGRFICTGNYQSKIIDPLQSRFQIFVMKTISEEFAIKYCTGILDKENVTYDEDTVRLVVQSILPDVRKVVQTLQQNVIDGTLKSINKESITSIEKKIVGLICIICDSIGKDSAAKVVNQNLTEIQSQFAEGEPDFLSMYESLFFNEKIPPWGKIAINKYSGTHFNSAFPHMHFISMIHEMVQNGMKYHKTFS